MKWNAENIDASYCETAPRFMNGKELAARQGIPSLIEEYRVSRVKNAISPQICEVASNPNAKILDAGCGHGWFPLRLIAESQDFQAKLICVDISPHNIRLLNQETENRGLSHRVSAKVANCEELPFEDALFDLVYSTESIEHMNSPERFLKEAARTLKPEGRLILTTPSGPMHHFWKTIATPFVILHRLSTNSTKKEAPPLPIYERALSKRELLRGIREAGFEIREYRKAIFLPHESLFQFLPLWASRILLLRAKLLEKLGPLTNWSGLHHIVVATKTTP